MPTSVGVTNADGGRREAGGENNEWGRGEQGCQRLSLQIRYCTGESKIYRFVMSILHHNSQTNSSSLDTTT